LLYFKAIIMTLTLKARLLQMDIKPANPEANANRITDALRQAAGDGVELLCVPEMCLTGFDWKLNRNLGERIEGALNTITRAVAAYGVVFCGSTYRLDDNGNATNSALLLQPNPDGLMTTCYAKAHLFALMDEPQHLTAGNEIVTVDTRWGKCGLAICYDLRFPEFFHAMALRGTRIILLPAAWPAKRCHHWRTLLQARAIENQCYMVAVNQSGVEGRFGYSGEDGFAGHSMVVDPFGNIIAELSETEGYLDVEMDLNTIDQARKAILTIQNRRPQLYGIG
jgi:omega-amidase